MHVPAFLWCKYLIKCVFVLVRTQFSPTPKVSSPRVTLRSVSVCFVCLPGCDSRKWARAININGEERKSKRKMLLLLRLLLLFFCSFWRGYLAKKWTDQIPLQANEMHTHWGAMSWRHWRQHPPHHHQCTIFIVLDGTGTLKIHSQQVVS